ncbi:TrmH family RNA methyltransferase [Clostridium tarantellae]|uniref:RNA methyltransferase n=1 Tax=Clostridium tarantellae TaxID=39493 RepID=A0A6I1MKC8_9CLOT|nr:RNA methyltransferase [Clostridium tarantellae]MPQ42632.1 RNA methyltransferase [Clostridium tarantellae]
MLTIESKNNSLYKELKKLKEKKHRVSKGEYLIEGLRFVEEAIKSKVTIKYIIFTYDFYEKNEEFFNVINEGVKCIVLSKQLFQGLTSTETPQGVVAVVEMQNTALKDGDIIVLVDKVQDPGNMGTIIRTAHAVGAAGIITTKGTVDIYNDKTLRSTMGSIFYLPVIEDSSLELIKGLKEQNFKLLVSSLQGRKNFFEENLQDKIIMAVGNEGNGVSDEVYELADIKVKIPMPGNAESLNVAVATSVMLYEKIRQNLMK